ncbi:hypothetical protein HOY80DRAFT_538514 [Tuber brumale]|nr:hypothetical protein HOY80DRAFT_538514 [Tuber brumale]
MKIGWTPLSCPQGSVKDPAFLQLSAIPSIDQLNHLSSTSFRTANLSHTNSFGNTNFFNRVWNNCAMAFYRSQLLTWLSPLEPGLRHQDIRERRVKDIGEWVLQTEEFRSWYAGSGGSGSDNAVLFCYGDSGVGKTYIR